MKTKEQYNQELNAAKFPGTVDYIVPRRQEAVIEVFEYTDLTIDHLHTVSEIFGTNLINIRSRSYSGGCETCGDSGSNVVLEISGIPL